MDERYYLQFYDDEHYLLSTVGPQFRRTGQLDAADFYTILIWKAERAKNRHKKRLTKIAGTFEAAVEGIARGLSESSERKQRLQILMDKWWFLLPTATFTVYDWRVCDEVTVDYDPWSTRDFSDGLWDHYELFYLRAL